MVLIAERDRSVRDLQAHFLDEAGFTVEFVDDGETALTRARLIAPAVVVTEIMIPKLDGLTLCRRLSEDPLTQSIPVVIFSILSAAARAQDAGAKAFLRKPIVGSVFIATLENLIAANSNELKEQQWA
jgi:two-component system response regulator MprA